MARYASITGCSSTAIDNSTRRPSAPILLDQMSIKELELALGAISERQNRDGIIEWLNISELLLCRARVMRQNLERLAIEWIRVNGAIDIGDIRYTVGYSKHVNCIDVIGCTHAVLDTSHGDIATLCEYFCSNPYKYGSVHKLVGDDLYARLFHVEQRPKLVEGKPQKELIRVDRRYVRSR